MTEAPSLSPGRPLKARFILHERLGSGGQGEVWRAHDPERRLDIALKILEPAPEQRAAAWGLLAHEHKAASRLDHPGILRVFPPEREPDGPALLLPMELGEGGDLRRLRGAGYLAVVPVLLEVAHALENAHEHGVVHRDLKPGNVLFDGAGHAKLADFGASAVLSGAGADPLPRPLSPFSASPQQLRGEPPAPADDIYGLGALAYELLARYPPHYPSFDAVRVQHEAVPPLVPAQPMPPQLGRLIERMLAKDARERPASMREVMDELDAALNDTLSFDFEHAEPGAATAPGAARAAEPAQARELPFRGSARRGPLRTELPRMLAVLAVLAAAALAAFMWLPRLELTSHAIPASAVGGPGTAEGRARLEEQRDRYDRELAALETRGAGVWGGADFAAAKTRAAESVGAYDAGSLELSQQRLGDAARLLVTVERAAPAALSAQLAAGDHALAAGQQELATQAFALAARIDPKDPRAALGEDRARRLGGILPLLADGENAQAAHDYARAAQDYARALSLDPKSEQARAGLARAQAAFGDDNYARAVGQGFAALGAGRLDEARSAFSRARTLRPGGPEAQDGLRRVAAAAGERSFSALRARAEALERGERWDQALALYDSALRQDRSLAFAQEGKARAASRLELESSLQALIERPDRLTSSEVHAQAIALLQSAHARSDPGPRLRVQMERLGVLLPEFDQPVRLSLVSDSLTQVAIPSVGTFGSFARRDIELKPGHYIVIGTRQGYRDVRREITLSPGQQTQTVSVSCSETI